MNNNPGKMIEPTNSFYSEIKIFSATFGQRLISRRKSLSLSQRELAEMMGVSFNTIRRYERGYLPCGSHFLALSMALRCSLNWLVGINGCGGYNEYHDYFVENNHEKANHSRDQFGQQKYFSLPEFLHVNSGDSSKHRVVGFDQGWLAQISTKPENLRLIVFKGPSMQPTLDNDDLLMIDSGQTEVFSGYLYLIQIEGMQDISRLIPKPNNYLRVVYDNYQMCPPYDLPAEQVEICGRIIWFSRSI